MLLKFNGLIIVLLLLFSGINIPCFSQETDLASYKSQVISKGIAVYHLNSGPFFSAKQNVLVVRADSRALRKYKAGIAWSDSALKKTSRFAEDTRAIVALNGSFFDVEKGGSVAYLESDGKVIARNRNSGEKWAKTDSLLNGAIVLTNSGRLKIEAAKSEQFYEQSDQERAVLVSGPVLLIDGQKVPLENSAFVHKRHPRSCLCETSDKSILFVAIDGRNENALGMNLEETQLFLLKLNCKNAINLDGGGSTTLWIDNGKIKGILNNPSDKEGERPVSNIILIKK
jgi:exopolysaccharide biosynthesis protein